MIDNSVYELFYGIKSRNMTIQQFATKLDNVLACASQLSHIRYMDKSLLAYSCMYESEDIFAYLLHAHAQSFQDELMDCLDCVYTNKSPFILELILQHLNELPSPAMQAFLVKVAHNCYREENIMLISQWLKTHAGAQQIAEFIVALAENDNVAFLKTISHDEFWSHQIQLQLDNIQHVVKKYGREGFYKKILAKTAVPTINSRIDQPAFTHSESLHTGKGLSQIAVVQTKIMPVVTKRKRKIPAFQAPDLTVK